VVYVRAAPPASRKQRGAPPRARAAVLDIAPAIGACQGSDPAAGRSALSTAEAGPDPERDVQLLLEQHRSASGASAHGSGGSTHGSGGVSAHGSGGSTHGSGGVSAHGSTASAQYSSASSGAGAPRAGDGAGGGERLAVLERSADKDVERLARRDAQGAGRHAQMPGLAGARAAGQGAPDNCAPGQGDFSAELAMRELAVSGRPRIPPRTNRTRRVPHPVLIGHAASSSAPAPSRPRRGERVFGKVVFWKSGPTSPAPATHRVNERAGAGGAARVRAPARGTARTGELPSRTNWTRLIPRHVLTGHVSSLAPR